MNLKEMYRQAWEKWGDLQWIMVIEECAELQQAVTKRLRDGDKPIVRQHLAEEIADVKIMIEQVESNDPDLMVAIDVFRERKLARLGNLLKEANDGK